MNGLILVDKPKGWTSFDVVAKVRGLLTASGDKKPKVGHCGTLDPLATGLLMLTLGTYCKRAQEFSKLDKSYEVELKLGETSTTDDDEGEKTPTNQPIPDEYTVKQTILSFLGEIEQVPPAFSAIKVGGKRAYKLAREGKEVKLKPRLVKIFSIENIKITGVRITFAVKVSSGTYIRSLVRDIGEKLGSGAYMTNLRRTNVGKYSVQNAQQISSLTPETIYKKLLE